MNEPTEMTPAPEWNRRSVLAMFTGKDCSAEDTRQRKATMLSMGAAGMIGVGIALLMYGYEQAIPSFEWLGSLLMLPGLCFIFAAIGSSWASKHTKRFALLLFNITGMFGMVLTIYGFTTSIWCMPFHLFSACLCMVVPISALMFVVAGGASLPAGFCLDAVFKPRGQITKLGCGLQHESKDT